MFVREQWAIHVHPHRHGRGSGVGRMAPTVERGMASLRTMAGPESRSRRSRSMSAIVPGGVRRRTRARAELGSWSICSPPARKRASHSRAVRVDTEAALGISAQPSLFHGAFHEKGSTMNGHSGALADVHPVASVRVGWLRDPSRAPRPPDEQPSWFRQRGRVDLAQEVHFDHGRYRHRRRRDHDEPRRGASSSRKRRRSPLSRTPGSRPPAGLRGSGPGSSARSSSSSPPPGGSPRSAG